MARNAKAAQAAAWGLVSAARKALQEAGIMLMVDDPETKHDLDMAEESLRQTASVLARKAGL